MHKPFLLDGDFWKKKQTFSSKITHFPYWTCSIELTFPLALEQIKLSSNFQCFSQHSIIFLNLNTKIIKIIVIILKCILHYFIWSKHSVTACLQIVSNLIYVSWFFFSTRRDMFTLIQKTVIFSLYHSTLYSTHPG